MLGIEYDAVLMVAAERQFQKPQHLCIIKRELEWFTVENSCPHALAGPFQAPPALPYSCRSGDLPASALLYSCSRGDLFLKSISNTLDKFSTTCLEMLMLLGSNQL